eukprot:scaffold43094_cov21-Tisochrysis_lutea.AAC.1
MMRLAPDLEKSIESPPVLQSSRCALHAKQAKQAACTICRKREEHAYAEALLMHLVMHTQLYSSDTFLPSLLTFWLLPFHPLQLLVDWSCLNRALRPRVLWVVVRCLEMPPHPDQKWDLAIKMSADQWVLRCRAPTDVMKSQGKTMSNSSSFLTLPLATLAATRASELMASAANGAMYQSGRQVGWWGVSEPCGVQAL